jgi:hypothetical protein
MAVNISAYQNLRKLSVTVPTEFYRRTASHVAVNMHANLFNNYVFYTYVPIIYVSSRKLLFGDD